MPTFPFTSGALLAAGAVYNPLIGWQYEYAPWPAKVSVLSNTYPPAATATVNLAISAGSEQIQESAPIQAGGTIRVTPNPLGTQAVVFRAARGDRLKLQFVSTGADAGVNGIITITPLAAR